MAGWISGTRACASRSSSSTPTPRGSRDHRSASRWRTSFFRSPSAGAGGWLAAGGYSHGQTGQIGGLVHCWDIAARRHLIRFFTNGGPVGRLAFTPTGQLLTADWAGTVALWEPIEGRLVRDWPRSHTGGLYHSLAVNASGGIALQREDGVYLWHPDPSRETLLCPARGFSNLAYSDDGRFVAGGRKSGRVDLFDATTGADVSPPDRHTTHVESIELSADGAVCLACLGYPGPHHANEVVLRDTAHRHTAGADASHGLATAGPGPDRNPDRRPAEHVPARRVGLDLG